MIRAKIYLEKFNLWVIIQKLILLFEKIAEVEDIAVSGIRGKVILKFYAVVKGVNVM